ncbi:MAG: SIMPL domain-containing protein [Chloroflexi bacterium]|nr:SIMPL domain-containing protein [Chloroflexota bacterium]
MSRRKSLIAILIISLLGAALGGLAFTQPQTTPASGATRTITVVGHGKVRVEPDVARAQIGVEVFAPTVKEATAKNREQMTAILEALQKAGIEEKDIQTSNYSINFEREPYMAAPMMPGKETLPMAEPQGRYRVSNMVQVTIRDLDTVAAVLDAAVEAGANTIWGVSFDIEDASEAESEARAKAMENARDKAAELAELAGVELGEVVSVSEVIGSPAFPVMGIAEAARAAFGGAGPIAPGELTFQAQLQVVFAIK